MENYYGSLCTKMYEILHREAPKDELEFYLSFAKAGDKILEPMCGSGRFILPFMHRGFDVSGFDLSQEMLDQLIRKEAQANVWASSMRGYLPTDKFDYIFMPSGSFCLLTDMDDVKDMLHKIRRSLKNRGCFVFAVDTVDTVPEDHLDYQEATAVRVDNNRKIVLKSKSYFNQARKILFSPSIYELYEGDQCIASEKMDFRLRLYEEGELDNLITAAGFPGFSLYRSFKSTNNGNKSSKLMIYECYI